MSWLTNIFSSGVDKVVDSVAKGLDNLFTSDEERLQLRNKLQEAMNEYNLKVEQAVNNHEKEITKRWVSDNEHIITRLIRPLSYAWVLFLFSAVVISDGNIGNFIVNSAYIPVLSGLLTTMTLAYFGSRGIEKGIRIWKSKDNNKKIQKD